MTRECGTKGKSLLFGLTVGIMASCLIEPGGKTFANDVPTEDMPTNVEELIANPGRLLQHLFAQWRNYHTRLTDLGANHDISYERVYELKELVSQKVIKPSHKVRLQIKGDRCVRVIADSENNILSVRGRNGQYCFSIGKSAPGQLFRVESLWWRHDAGYDRFSLIRTDEFYGYIVLGSAIGPAAVPWVLLESQSDRIIARRADLVTDNHESLIVVHLAIGNLDRISDPHSVFRGQEYAIDTFQYDGKLAVSPRDHWLPVHADFNFTRTLPGFDLVGHLVAEWTYLRQHGLPVVGSFKGKVSYTRGKQEEGSETWEVRSIERTYSEPPDKVFLLSHYGLTEPEPPEGRAKNVVWLWSLLGGLIALLLGLSLWAARRRGRKRAT